MGRWSKLLLQGFRRKYVAATGFAAALIGGYGGAMSMVEQDGGLGNEHGVVSDIISGSNGILRSFRAVRVFTLNSLDYKAALHGLELQSEEYLRFRSEVNLRAAQRLLALCQANKGIYTKAGQFVASLQHVPKEFTSTLSVLQDQAPPRPFAAIDKVFRSEFGRSALEIFTEFDTKPIAAASLAQVHRATLREGREVAVKVQYPGLERQFETDITTMRVLSRAVAWLFPGYEFEWIVPEFESNLLKELDFKQEARNAERAASNFAHRPEVQVPAIEWALTTKRILTMEFMRGCKVDDVEAIQRAGIDPKQVAKVLAEVFGEMIFCHGYVHGDPHPGNLFVRTCSPSEQRSLKSPYNFQIVLLDHGLYRELDEAFRKDYCRLWEALVTADANALASAASRLGIADYARFLPLMFTGRPLESRAALGESMTAEERMTLRSELQNATLGDFSTFMEALPRDMLTILRTDGLVKSILAKLGAPKRQRLFVNIKYAAEGLALHHKGEPDSQQPGVLWHLQATLDYSYLLLCIELRELSILAWSVWASWFQFIRILRDEAWRRLSSVHQTRTLASS